MKVHQVSARDWSILLPKVRVSVFIFPQKNVINVAGIKKTREHRSWLHGCARVLRDQPRNNGRNRQSRVRQNKKKKSHKTQKLFTREC